MATRSRHEEAREVGRDLEAIGHVAARVRGGEVVVPSVSATP